MRSNYLTWDAKRTPVKGYAGDMAKGNLPFESLTAATAAGPGAVNDLQDTLALHSLTAQITDFAGTGNWTIRLEASLDNVNFVALQSQTLNEDVNIHFVGVVTFPARYVRANLLLDSGVTSITVTAWVASA